MNIQQVKGEVGDGEDDITEESLTKYEAAAKSLSVSLKEVKDGVTVLRNPMEVLNDLAEAFNKEADDSIKKVNLINALGGKYRGNQLAALLSNWETYNNILEDFNSDKALGSAVRESQKDVASWTGQVNILKINPEYMIHCFTVVTVFCYDTCAVYSIFFLIHNAILLCMLFIFKSSSFEEISQHISSRVLLKHHIGSTLLIVCALHVADNEAIKQNNSSLRRTKK